MRCLERERNRIAIHLNSYVEDKKSYRGKNDSYFSSMFWALLLICALMNTILFPTFHPCGLKRRKSSVLLNLNRVIFLWHIQLQSSCHCHHCNNSESTSSNYTMFLQSFLILIYLLFHPSITSIQPPMYPSMNPSTHPAIHSLISNLFLYIYCVKHYARN